MRTHWRHSVELLRFTLERRTRRAVFKRLDRIRPTFSNADRSSLTLHLPMDPVQVPEGAVADSRAITKRVVALYLDHQFDILGSGWTAWSYGAECKGFCGVRYDTNPAIEVDQDCNWLSSVVNPANLPESIRLWRMVSPGYRPIDWQRDCRSGYRWSAQVWFADITRTPADGADIKVPWELGRLQHLGLLATEYLATCQEVSEGGEEMLPHATRLRDEFRNQVLDFIATNPPRFGVNWRSAMDVAIRTANLVVAHALFTQVGGRFDLAFEKVLARTIHEHVSHVYHNREWHSRIRANHYLANISGLLFGTAALRESRQASAWFRFASRELLREIVQQFSPDGSNFEASTCYHRLSAEMAVFATALLVGSDISFYLGQPEEHGALSSRELLRRSLVATVRQRLSRMTTFAEDVMKPSGNAVQIGDNDSGRFFKLEFRSRRTGPPGVGSSSDTPQYPAEDHLSFESLIDAGRALFDDGASGAGSRGRPVWDAAVVRALSRGRTLPAEPHRYQGPSIGTDEAFHAQLGEVSRWPPGMVRAQAIPLTSSASIEAIDLRSYPDFGLFIWRHPTLFLSVRCGSVGQHGNGGHAHSDQLAVELWDDGRDVIRDPGSYVYTASSELRNLFRSTKAHFVPRPFPREPSRLDLGIFRLEANTNATCLYFGRHGFWGFHRGYGPEVHRIVAWEYGALRIYDWVCELTTGGTTIPLANVEWQSSRMTDFSPGYGILERVDE